MWSDSGIGSRECWDSSITSGSSWSNPKERKHNCWIVLEFRVSLNWIDRFALKESGTKWTLRRKGKAEWVNGARARRESKGVGDWSWCLEKNTTKTWSRKR